MHSPSEESFKYRLNSPKFLSLSTENDAPPYTAQTTTTPLRTTHYTTETISYSAHGTPFKDIEFDSDYYQRNTTASILATFRELQAKVKVLERNRAIAIQERDRMKEKLTDHRRELNSWKNQQEYQTTDSLLNVRSHQERLRLDYDDLHLKIDTVKDINKSILSSIETKKSLIHSLFDDINESKLRIDSLERRHQYLYQELDMTKKRQYMLQEHVNDVPEDIHSKCVHLEQEINILRIQINETLSSNERFEYKHEALQRYVVLLVRMNEDLLNTISLREAKKQNILLLAEKYTPPRYAWPKNTIKPSIEDISSIVHEAATASALNKSIEENLLDGIRDCRRYSTGTTSMRDLYTSARSNNTSSILATPSRKKKLSFSQSLEDFEPSQLLSMTMKSPNGLIPKKSIMKRSKAKSPSKSRSNVIEHRAAEAIATSFLTPNRNNSSNSVDRLLSKSQAFIPTSVTSLSKEFNKVAVSSIEDRDFFHKSVISTNQSTQ